MLEIRETRFRDISEKLEISQEEVKTLNEYLEMGHQAFLEIEAEYKLSEETNYEMAQKLHNLINKEEFY